MNLFVITALGGLNQWVVTQNSTVLGEYTSLLAAMTYVAGVIKVGESVLYASEAAGTPQ